MGGVCSHRVALMAVLDEYWGGSAGTPSPSEVLCGETDADSALLAISQLATHHYVPLEMWKAAPELRLKSGRSRRNLSL